MKLAFQLGKLGSSRAPRRMALLAARRGNSSSASSGTKVVASLTGSCPSCGRRLPTSLPVCPGCNYIARMHESITHHEMLGIPYRPNPFVVDAGVLKRRFLEAQRMCHPDGWATKGQGEKDAALDVSNAVNRAYKTLSSPVERIAYILRQNGIEMEESDQLEDLDLIDEVMEVREEIESLRGRDEKRLAELREENEVKRRSVIEDIEESVGREDWGETKRRAVRLKYLQGINDAIDH